MNLPIWDNKNNFLSSDMDLNNTKEYQEIISVVDELHRYGVLQRTSGNCVAISDIIFKLLKSRGIECKLVECSLLIFHKSTNSINFVGYEDNQSPTSKISSHVVCVTKTPIPILIDLSVPFASSEKPYIIEKVNGTGQNFAEYKFGDTEWFYSEKSYSHLPNLHQQSIVDRIETDLKIESRIQSNENQIKMIQRIVTIILCVSSLNLIRGAYDHYQKYIVKDNGFGPNKIHYQNPERIGIDYKGKLY